MSVDYNELYQEFIVLTSSPSASSSSPVPSPSSPQQQGCTGSRKKKACSPTSNKGIMSSIQLLNESGSDHLVSPQVSTNVVTSVVSSSTFSNPHPYWHQQQQQHQPPFGEKRKDVSPCAPSPSSPTEPPTKKQAFKDGKDDNNNCFGGSNQVPGNCDPTPVTGVGAQSSTSSISSVNNMGSSQVNTSHFPRENHTQGELEGTSCVIIHKPPHHFNELRRLLTTGPCSRSSSYNDNFQSAPPYMSQAPSYLPPYPTMINGTNVHSCSTSQENWMSQPNQGNMERLSHDSMESHNHQNMQIHQLSNDNVEEVVKFNPWAPSQDGPAYPGGLEVLWKEVNEECRKLMTPQDVPDTARSRGYFTVSELLHLKRNLQSKYNDIANGVLHPIRSPPLSATAVAAAAAAAQAAEIMNAGVGGIVKEALDVLDEQQQHQLTNIVNGNEGIQHSSLDSTVIHQPDGMLATNASKMYFNGQSELKHVPPPAYRTSTLVLKLLQIGNHCIRSFFENNPNRLKVLYNSQRLTYECHLPSIQRLDAPQYQRRVLTIDVNFDQITDIKFGSDKMILQVEGTPILTVSHNLANEVPHAPTLTTYDQKLLEEIDKGSLKLTPCHQLFFINERLVQNLKSQLKEHPKFRHLLSQSQIPIHGR